MALKCCHFPYTFQPHTTLYIAAKINSPVKHYINKLTVKELLSIKEELGSVTRPEGHCICQILK